MTQRPDPVVDDRLAVFMPALMGVGILVSGAVVFADWARHLLPSGAVRRQHRIAMAAHGIAERVAASAGYAVRTPHFPRRVARSRSAYLLAGAAIGALAYVTVRSGVTAYLNPFGWLYGHPWILGLGVGIGALLALLAFVALLPAMVSLQSTRAVSILVEATWLGRLVPPPTDPRTLAGIAAEQEEDVI